MTGPRETLFAITQLMLALGVTGAGAQTVPMGVVEIEITGLQEARGSVFIAMYDSKDSWLGDEGVVEREVIIGDALDGDVVRTRFELPQGGYAFALYFDANGNGKIDRNFIGIPKEPIVLSNNVRPRFSMPKYKNSVFTLSDEPLIQRVDIK